MFDSFCSHLECGPVGVADKNTISDARITASTFHNARHNPKYGRLHERRQHGAWCTKTKTDRKDYFQVDMGTVLSVCAVASQGERKYPSWTTSYKLYLSTDGVTWNAYGKPALRRFDRQLLVMIIGPGSVQFSELQKRLNTKLQISVERFQHEPLGSEDWVTTPYVTDVK